MTLGPGPDVLWYATFDPPKLGALVKVDAQRAVKSAIEWKGRKGTMMVLQGVVPHIEPSAYAVRVVAPEWIDRVKATMKRPLYPYQYHGAAWLAAELASGRSAILADDMGLGKSSQSIAAILATGMTPALIVCLASLKYNWSREFQFAKNPPSIEIVKGRRGPIRGAQVVIINYDLLKFREEQLLGMGFRVIVFDEAHEIKEARPAPAHRAAVATRVVRAVGRTLLLTGTPALNRPSEMWRLLHIADPKEWASYEEFQKRYVKPPPPDEVPFERRPVKRLVTSRGRVENVDEFQVRIQPLMLRRLKSEVQKDLPPKSRTSLLVSLDQHDEAQYKAAEKDVVEWLRSQKQGDAKARAAARAQAIVRLTALRKLAALGKMRRAVPEYLEQWFAGSDPQPMVIFAYHREVCAGLYSICQGFGLRVVGIGDESIDKRQLAVDAFQNGFAEVFVAPIRAAGVGLNLHRAADSLFIERDWTPSRMEQCESRLHRIGQRRPVMATYLDASNTIDEYIAEVLEAKQKLITTAVDGILPAESSGAEVFSTVDAVVDKIANKADSEPDPDA